MSQAILAKGNNGQTLADGSVLLLCANIVSPQMSAMVDICDLKAAPLRTIRTIRIRTTTAADQLTFLTSNADFHLLFEMKRKLCLQMLKKEGNNDTGIKTSSIWAVAVVSGQECGVKVVLTEFCRSFFLSKI